MIGRKPVILFGPIVAGWMLWLLGFNPLADSASLSIRPNLRPTDSSAVPIGASSPEHFRPVPGTSPIPDYFKPAPGTSPVPDYFRESGNGASSFPGAAQTPIPNATPEVARTAADTSAKAGGGTVSGSRVEFFMFDSASLNRPMHYLIYLPAGYDSNLDRRYPVLYMLHGVGGGFGGINGTETELPGYGMLSAADDLIAKGEIQPMLIVFPEGDQGYWMDHADGGDKYGSYVVEDVVSQIDRHFRTLPDRSHRAVGGISMGGFGALELAMLHPEIFGTAGAHSPSLPSLQQAPQFFGDAAYFEAHDPAHLIANHAETARTLRLWLDIGDHDPLWLAATDSLHDELVREGIPHEWHHWPGQHDGFYWGAHMEDYLRFYDSGLIPSAG